MDQFSEKLLQLLRERNLLTAEVAEQVRRDASLSRRPVEDIIHERFLVNDDEVAKVKSAIIGIPYKKVNPAEITDDLLKLVPEETAQNYGVIPLARTDRMLVVGMVRPQDTKAQEALKFVGKQLRMDLGIYVVSFSDLEEVLRRYAPYKTEVEAALKALNLPAKASENVRHVVRLEKGAVVAEEAPIIRIVAATFKEAVKIKASDVHIEPQRNRLRIRFRLDGELQEVASFPLELHQPIVSRVKILSNLKIDETRIPQDGRFRTIIMARDIDFRVASFPTPSGEKVAIRVLDPTVGLRSLSDLGLSERVIKTVTEGIKKPFGMVLLTGPTGSGKTTTLYALMQILNKEDVNVVSLEDPVEYFMDGLNQSQIRPEIGYDFASGLRQILRQDPDVIMVGEIRDNETAGLAVHAALTGHIVLSTLHTNNSVGVIPRLLDMGVEPFLLPPSLNIMAAQRLIVKLCQFCKKAEPASAEVATIIKKELQALPSDVRVAFKEPFSVFHSLGCDKCNHKGVSGRIALFEVLRMTPELQATLTGALDEQKIVEEAKRQNMVTLRQDGVLKALEGVVAIEEVLRETE